MPAGIRFKCTCGAVADSERPVYCPACGRVGTFQREVNVPSVPHVFESPVLSASDLRAQARRMQGLPGSWREISDRWAFPFLMCVYGLPGTGKTTRALKLADDWPGRSIFLSLEQGLGANLAGYVERLEITKTSFYYPQNWDELLAVVRGFDLVVVDSVQMLDAQPGSVRSELVDRARKNVIVTSQTNADGDVRGGMAVSHLADYVVQCHGLDSFEVTKNRTGTLQEVTHG